MKHLFTRSSKLLIVFMLWQFFCPIIAQCQSALEFFNNGMSTTTQGASITTGAIKVALNTDNPTGNTNNLTYSATPITVTYTLSNQQFGNDASSYAAVFGANLDGNAPIFIPMNSYGSPTNSMFTSGSVSGNGIDVDNNYTAQLYTRGAQFSNNISGSSRQRIADLTITFSSPISNPILHIGGSGGFTGSFGASTEFDLIQVNTNTTGLSWTRLSGNYFFAVSGTSIANSADRFTSSSSNSPNASSSGISGSVRVNGVNITTVVLRVYLHGDGYLTSGPGSSNWQSLGDATDLGVSFPFGQYTIQGTVRNDADITDGIGGTQFYNGPTALYAYLISPNGKLVAVTQVSNVDGTYSFSNQSYPVGGSHYSIVLSADGSLAVDGTVNAPNATTPSGWIYVGSNTYNASTNTTTTTTGNAIINNLPSPTTSTFGGVSTYQNIDFAVSEAFNLPVVLQQFNGINQNGAVQLKWSTASEVNAQSFEIQRSNDGGKTWSAIGNVNAVGNSTTVQQYNFTDIAPLAANQYRLKMIDADGSSEISKLIVAVNLGQNAVSFKVIPNPIISNGHGKILLNAPLETKSELRIVDIAGRTVKTYPVPAGTQTVEFATDGLAKGIYIVTLATTNGVQHDKILIN